MRQDSPNHLLSSATSALPRKAPKPAGTLARYAICAILAAAAALFSATAGHADITATGSISPDLNVSGWTIYTQPTIGWWGDGTVTVSGGSVTPMIGATTLGYLSGRTGTINVDGAGSMWQETDVLTIGANYPGFTNLMTTGIVNVTNGGAFVIRSMTDLGSTSGSTGIISVSGAGSTFTATGAFGVGGNGYNFGDRWNTGTGIVKVTQGGTLNITNYDLSIGLSVGDSGFVLIDGAGSLITAAKGAGVGGHGTGTLMITNGGSFISGTTAQDASVIGGQYSQYTTLDNHGNGYVIVNGAGSTWKQTGAINFEGDDGSGSLSISNGGAVSANSVTIASGTILTVDAGYGSTLTVGAGSGTLTNNGTLRLVAGAAVAAGAYKPVYAGEWDNNGTFQVIGGTYNWAKGKVVVNPAATAAAGTAATIDLSQTQRILFADASSGKSAGASFIATTASSALTLTASMMSGAELAPLAAALGAGKSILSGWDFTAESGYTAGSPTYLSLYAGAGQDLSDLAIWHYNGSTWSAYTAGDISYDGTYASFTVTGLGGYAVVDPPTPTPIPSALLLLAPGLAGIGFLRRRRSAERNERLNEEDRR